MCSLFDLYVLVRVEDLVEGELYVSEADAECPAPHWQEGHLAREQRTWAISIRISDISGGCEEQKGDCYEQVQTLTHSHLVWGDVRGQRELHVVRPHHL